MHMYIISVILSENLAFEERNDLEQIGYLVFMYYFLFMH